MRDEESRSSAGRAGAAGGQQEAAERPNEDTLLP